MTYEKKLARWTLAKEALAKSGSVRKAADQLGIPASTFQGWIGALNDPYQPTTGFSVNAEAVTLGPDGEVKTRRLSLKKDNNTDLLVEALKAAFRPFKGKAVVPGARPGADDLITIYPIPDLHFGMYAWRPESGDDYDTDIAANIAVGALHTLVSQSHPSHHAVVLGLGDYFHANDRREVTMASGHKLDMDGRWMKVISEGTKLARDLVDIVASKHFQTEVAFIQGNHDPDASVALTVAMSLFYDCVEGVSVTENANIMWHRKFGNNLLAATHGHTMKPDRFAMAVACDFAREWGNAEHRHGFMGHIHHETAKEVAGMRIESFQSPAAKDSFNAAAGYRSGRSLTAITFHREFGEIGRHRVNIGGFQSATGQRPA